MGEVLQRPLQGVQIEFRAEDQAVDVRVKSEEVQAPAVAPEHYPEFPQLDLLLAQKIPCLIPHILHPQYLPLPDWIYKNQEAMDSASGEVRSERGSRRWRMQR